MLSHDMVFNMMFMFVPPKSSSNVPTTTMDVGKKGVMVHLLLCAHLLESLIEKDRHKINGLKSLIVDHLIM